jgi:N-acetyl-gamma-glutamyl-phosphate reductase
MMHRLHRICIIRIPVITVAIIGSAGYTGQETLDRVLGHPGLELLAAGSNTFAGRPGSALDPRLDGGFTFVTNDEAAASGADVIFLCAGNEAAAAFEPPDGAVVIDLSGVHRLRDAEAARRWYSLTPGAWSYGLPEVSPAEGPLIANPGCHATAAALALAPVRGLVTEAVVDSKTGMTGAGRELKASSHAGFVLENLTAYAVGAHRHAPEIEQVLGFPVSFVPHLLPVRRGVVATCYFRADADLRPLYEDFYAGSEVVRLLPGGVVPELSRVQNTDAAELGLFVDASTGMKIVICAEDNLGKGAAGQAVQNVNLALGLDETAGLRLKGVTV